MNKIDKKFAPIISASIMGTIMSFIMTAIITALNLGGFPQEYFFKWMSAFGVVIFIVIPIILFVRPIVEKIMKNLIKG